MIEEANLEASVGSIGDSYDNAMAGTINGFYIKQRSYEAAAYGATLRNVEFSTLEWVDWFNNRRLLELIGNIPPVEFEKAYYCQLRESADAA